LFSLLSVCLGTIVVFFSIFEANGYRVEKTVLIAVLSAAAAAGRVIFAAVPSVQPVSFIVILTGMVFGVEAGFLTGAMGALLSSLLMGFGPWTVWQMFAWGAMGMVSALAGGPLLKNRALLIAYSAAWGLLFGWIMNVWMFFTVTDAEASGFAYVLAIYAASLPFDAAHGAFNGILAAVAGGRMIRMLARAGGKFGLAHKTP